MQKGFYVKSKLALNDIAFCHSNLYLSNIEKPSKLRKGILLTYYNIIQFFQLYFYLKPCSDYFGHLRLVDAFISNLNLKSLRSRLHRDFANGNYCVGHTRDFLRDCQMWTCGMLINKSNNNKIVLFASWSTRGEKTNVNKRSLRKGGDGQRINISCVNGNNFWITLSIK